MDSRRARRHHTNLLSCGLGDVIDLSVTGMRVKCKSKPPVKIGQVLQIKVESAAQRIPVCGRVQWIKRRGLRSYQIGVHFVNIKASAAAALESLALFGFVDPDAAVAARRRMGESGPSPKKERPMRAAVDLPDYYGVLGVSPAASLKEIKQAHRTLALKYHPDVTDEPGAAERFIKVTEAYQVLSDNASRRSYDERRAAMADRVI